MSRYRYAALAVGTVSLIQLSCIIEEYIFKQLVRHFKHFWFVALVELLLFTIFSFWSLGGSSALVQRPTGPSYLYVCVGVSLAAGTGLGKVAFGFLNYATATVLKSMKLLPVMALSVCWLRRRFHFLQVVAACFMVSSAALFGLGERAVEPDFHPLGIFLSFLCLLAQALQNVANERLLLSHGAGVHETMAWSNGVGFLATLLVTICNGELGGGFAFFAQSWVYWALLLLRCVLFYAGAVLYTMLLKDGGAAGAVFVTTTRKALTVVISFIAFPKPFSSNYGFGGALMLMAIYLEYEGKAALKRAGVGGPGSSGHHHEHGNGGGARGTPESTPLVES